MKLMSIFGTRPEAIKMAPVLAALRGEAAVRSVICVTGQHREMLDPVLALFDVMADYDLRLMQEEQSLNSLTSRAIHHLDRVLAEERPDMVLVQGDTSTALAGAIAAFHRGVAVAHVEAGLRTWCNRRPFPEEVNRRTVDGISSLLFAPTLAARDNILSERLPGRTIVTGNTSVDALRMAIAMLDADPEQRIAVDRGLPMLDPERKLLLVTCHRRESFGAGFAGVCTALRSLAAREDVEIVYPLHLNPRVAGSALETLGGLANLHLLPPQGFLPFVRLMQRADVILTDSGGIQEEAPSLGKPVLVMREVSERPEAIDARSARLVGTDPAGIEREVGALVEAAAQAHIPPAANPYGDGRAAARIVDALLGRPVEEFGAADFPPAEIARIA